MNVVLISNLLDENPWSASTRHLNHNFGRRVLVPSGKSVINLTLISLPKFTFHSTFPPQHTDTTKEPFIAKPFHKPINQIHNKPFNKSIKCNRFINQSMGTKCPTDTHKNSCRVLLLFGYRGVILSASVVSTFLLLANLLLKSGLRDSNGDSISARGTFLIGGKGLSMPEFRRRKLVIWEPMNAMCLWWWWEGGEASCWKLNWCAAEPSWKWNHGRNWMKSERNWGKLSGTERLNFPYCSEIEAIWKNTKWTFFNRFDRGNSNC